MGQVRKSACHASKMEPPKHNCAIWIRLAGCFGNHGQAKRCVRHQPLRACFGPTDPTWDKFGNAFTRRSKENNCYTGQAPTQVNIVNINYQMLIQLGMRIPLDQIIHNQVRAKRPRHGGINGALFDPSGGVNGANQYFK